MDGQHNYPDIDVRDTTSPHVTGTGRARPDGALLHTTAGRSSLFWLTGGSYRAGAAASADYLIEKDGTRYAICPVGRYPYHAGVSAALVHGLRLSGDALSAALIGIEIEELPPEPVLYTQLDSCAELLVLLAGQYEWRWPFLIYGHYGVALPAGRKSDPYGLDWGALMGRIYAYAVAAGLPGL